MYGVAQANVIGNVAFVTSADGSKTILYFSAKDTLNSMEQFYTENKIAWNVTGPFISSGLYSESRLFAAERYKLLSKLGLNMKQNKASFLLQESSQGIEHIFTDATGVYDLSSGMLTYLKDTTRVNGQLYFNATLGWDQQQIAIGPTPKPTMNPTNPTMKPSPKPSSWQPSR